MGDTKKKLDHLSYISIDKEADILDQLKYCQIFFQHIADPSVIGNISQFYDNLRVLIGILQKLPSELEWHTREIIGDINISLLNTISSCSIPLDGQMMCSAAFCAGLQAVLETHERETLYSLCLNTDGYIFYDLGWPSIHISVKNVELLKVCLCHGILQSNEVSNVLLKGSVVGSQLIYVMLNILEEACMKYTKLTSIAFKVLVSWIEKVCLELKLNVTSDPLRRIFSIINSNWESPISGVKAQNTRLFKLYLDICSTNEICWYDCDAAFKSVTGVLCHIMEVQPWKMKSKYCMLNVLLPRYGVKKAFEDFPDLAPGLISSLSYSHLASAGSDVYKTCLENMDENNWITVFMTPVVEMLTSTDVINIEKQNAFNYWIPSTLKKFPLLLNSLFDQLIDAAQSSGLENSVFSLISLLKLGQKFGLLFNTWDEKFSINSFKFFDFLNLINSAIQHSSETVRAEAFAVVCVSSKTCIMPSLKEFELVQIFLLENVNIDSSSLRQAILNSFTLFLTRIHDSCLHRLKVKYGTQIPEQCGTISKNINSNSGGNKEVDIAGMSQNIQFFKWLHNFLISNLEPGTNYQRKILSLKLYMLVLSYFSEPPEWPEISPGIRRKGVAAEGEKVLKHTLKHGQWPFNSESSYKTLLRCVLDPTDDIREAAGLILMKYFSFKESDTEENKYLVDYASQLCTSPMFYEAESGALLMKIIGNWTYRMPPKISNKFISSMVGIKCNEKMIGNRERMLHNQQKLLSGLQNKHSKYAQNKVETERTVVKLKKKKMGTYEKGMVVVHPSLLKDICGAELSDETKIFEGMAVIARDGLVGQSTVSSVSDKSHCLSDKKTYTGVDKANNIVNGDEMKPLSYNMTKRNETPPDLWESHTSQEVGVESFFGGYSSRPYHHSPPVPDSYNDRDDYFFLENLGKVCRKSISEMTNTHTREHVQYMFESQVEQVSWNRQGGGKQEVDYQPGIQTSQRPLASPKRQILSRKGTILKNFSKSKQVEVMQFHKSKGLVVTGSTEKVTRNNPLMNRSRDFEDSSMWRSQGVYSTTLSSYGYESHKFPGSLYFESSIITDTDISSLQTGSQPRKHNAGNNSDQRNKKFHFPQLRYKDCIIPKQSNAYTQQNAKPDDRKLFLNDDFALNEPPERKYVHKSENNVGESSYRLPPRNYSKNLAFKTVSQTYYNGSAPLSAVVLTQAEAQLTSLKGDLVQAASSGSPLHGALTALIRLATQSDGPECGHISTEEVERTVTLLEQTVSFFLDLLAEKSASTTDVAPSFAEMDEAIHCSIQQSLSDVSVDEEGLHLSPAHQLVLNCVWLNLKACCALASGLACNADCSVAVVKRCARVITQVLMRCRHKGAIESAGVALSALVKTVTSQTKECNHTSDKDLHLMLEQLLTEFLHSIVHGSNKASVTRRSAGLSILIHRIVASDMQTGKPLLHMCMSQLLEIARAPLGHDVISEPGSGLTDLPQAQALHFLKVLVQDSSLRQDIAQYMSSVTIICFSNFSSPVWTVRNAALQLSGALIPKLVGQKKIQDEELTLGSSVSVEEFFCHFPELTEFMLNSVQKAAKCHPSQALQQHADLIPMLSLLAKVSIGSEVFISMSLAETIAQYRALFLQLISSPIYHVRKLAAKAYERFMPFSSTYNSIVTIVDKLCMCNTNCDGIHSSCLGFRENYLNGILLTLKYLLEKLKHDSENMSELKSKIPEIITVLKDSVSNCMIWDSCTYFNRVLLLELIEDKFNAVDAAYISTDETFTRILDVRKTLENENFNNSFKPGLLLWAAKVVEVVVRKCYPQHLVSTWYNSYTLCSHYPDIVRSSLTSLKLRLLHDKKIDSAIKASLFIALLKVCLEITEECHALFPLFDLMLVLMQEPKVNVVITFKELKEISMWLMSDRKNKSEYCKTALPVVAGLLSQYFAHGQCIELSTQTLDFVLELSLCIKDRTDVMKYEEDFRLNAATAMCLLAPTLQAMSAEKFKEFSTEEVLKVIIEILLDVQLTLLQDEDHDVRKEAAKFVHAYTAEINRMTISLTVNPFASLKNLMKPDVLLTMLTVPQAMEFLWKKMHYTHDLESIKGKLYRDSHENDSITSPFDLGTNNIYNEETKIIDVLGKSLLEIIKVANRKERNGLRKLINYKFVNFKDDVGTVLSLLKRKESCGIYSTSSNDETCYIVAKKLIYQSEVIEALRIKGNRGIGSVMVELQQFLKFSTN